MSTIDWAGLGLFPNYNGCNPPEGAADVPVPMLFNAAANAATGSGPSFIADLVLMQQQHKFSFAQALFVDNSRNLSPLSITANGTIQLIKVPAGWQGYVNCLVPNPAKITFDSAPAIDTRVFVFLLNFPVNTFLWPSDPNGAVIPFSVSDTVLDALLVNGYLPVLSQQVRSAGVVVPSIVASKTKAGKTAAAGDTDLLTPAAFFKLGAITIGITGDASLAVAGVLNIQLQQAAIVIAQASVFVPVAAPALPLIYPALIDRQCDYWSTVAADKLQINLSDALTSGSVWYSVDYAETTISG